MRTQFQLLLASAGLAALSGAAASAAEDPPAQASQVGQVQEVIVTAQKRSESANKVGMSITAVTQDALTARGVESAADLVKVVPGFIYTPTPYNTPVYTLRGVGYFDNSLAASPAVSVSVDEVPLAFPAMTQAASLDLQQVEVLKGPQGTLYGQNTTGGAINYIAAKPTNSFEAGADLTGARFGQVDADGFVSGPLSDTLKARAAFKIVNGGAWQESASRPGDVIGAKRQDMGRILLDWTPTSKLHVAVNLNGWRDNSDTLAGQVIAVVPTVPARVSPGLQVQTPLDGYHADWTPTHPMRAHDSFYEASARVDYKLSDTLKLTSISAFQHFKQDKFSDLDASPVPTAEFHQTGSIQSFSQEWRLTGDTGPARWIVGANYAYGNVHDDLFDDLRASSITDPLGPLVPPFSTSAAATRQLLNTYSGFGNVQYELTPHVSLIGGLRYTEADRKFDGCTLIVDPNAAQLVDTLQYIFKGSVIPVSVGQCGSLDKNNDPAAFVDKLKEHNLSYRTGVNYKFDSGALVYASVNQGYKSGGFPVLLTLSTDSFSPIPQEKLIAYEAGLKLPLFERRAQLNAAAFYYDYTDKQLHGRTLDPYFGLIEKLVSVPRSNVEGAEISLDARPFRGLSVNLAGTYVDTDVLRYTGYNAAGVLANYRGSAFPFTSKYQASGDAQYAFSVGAGLSAFVGGGFTFVSAQSATFGSDPIFRLRPYTLVDLRAGVQTDDQRWRLTVWGRNITDAYYWNGIFQGTDDILRQPGMPATYGVTLSARFH